MHTPADGTKTKDIIASQIQQCLRNKMHNVRTTPRSVVLRAEDGKTLSLTILVNKLDDSWRYG